MGPAMRWARHRSSPWFVTWALTDRCNYTCDHCGCWREPGRELTREQALQYAREMVELGVIGLNICGGEVLLRSDLGEVLDVLGRGGAIIRVTTNGRLVPKRIRELLPVHRIKISLDGPPDLHDEVRGRGAYGAIVDAIAAARGVGLRVQLNTVLTRALIERLDELLETAGALGAPVTFQPPEVRHESARLGVAGVMPETERMRGAIARLRELKAAGDRRLGNSPGTFEYMARWPELPPMDCHAGRRFVRVLSDGRVVACDRPYAPHPPPPPVDSPPGFAASVARLERAGMCQGCWRNNTIELNRALGGAADAWGSVRKWI